MKFLKNNVLILSVLLIFVLVACNSNDETTNEEADGENESVLDVALQSVPPALDPHMSTSTMTAEMSRNVYEPLVTIDENYEVQPMIAESWEVNDDYTVYTFHLRDEANFHNEKELTSEDVVASLERWLSINQKAAVSLGENTEITAIDDGTVEITHENTNFLTLEVLAMPSQFGGIMPKETVESAGTNPVEEYIGTGPYKVVEYVSDQHLILEKHNEYVPREEEPSGLAGAKNALIDTINFSFVSDESTRLSGLIAGEYDIVRNLPYDNFAQLESDPAVEPQLSEGGSDIIIFNKKEGIFTDQKARQALQAGLDLEALSIGTYGDNQFFTLNSSLSMEEQVNWYTEAGSEYYNQNDEGLYKQLLDESEYDGETVRILASNNITHYNIAITLQQELESLGMNTDLETYDFATVLDYRQDPAIWDILISDLPTEANPTLINYLDSDFEYVGWSDNEKIDEIIEKIRSASSYEEANHYVDELQEAYYDYVPVIKPSNRFLVAGVSKDLNNYYDFSNGTVLWNISK